MNLVENKVTDIKIAYIGGGSKGWAWSFMSDLAFDSSLSGEIYLYDIDKEAGKRNEIIGNKISAHEKSVSDWKYKFVDNIEEALTGCDFVVISILPGTFEEMYSDVHEVEKLGMLQPVGDTTGPGGILRAIRTIPMYQDIAESIKKYSPNAWVINYTNPMSLCVKTLYEVYPEIKAIGCCHEVFGTQHLLANMCEEVFGKEKIKREEIEVSVLGINHFTWLNSAKYNGEDLFPHYKEFVDKYYETGYEKEERNWMNSFFNSANRIKFDLFRRYGLIAAAGDRHLSEFMPNTEYLNDKDTIASWMFNLTPVSWRIENQKNMIEKSIKLANGEEEVVLKASGEEGVQLIKALAGLEPKKSNVIIKNFGQIANLPLGTIVETNAYFTKDKVEPVDAIEIPENILELILPHMETIDLTYKAATTYDKDLIVKAFLVDPLFKSKCTDVEKTKEIVESMLNNTKKYLPKEWNL